MNGRRGGGGDAAITTVMVAANTNGGRERNISESSVAAFNHIIKHIVNHNVLAFKIILVHVQPS
ncbi:hypothetical protein BVC80_887g4 [Macleaya cordata]|uniref:Uncharacterized protein n=1 Tax=Macleaya cordata TaxID=56857 RepID=A0A200RDF4_MACCD|nr:hypothetical protein BVC80_887g4 [Macleaya cordata]